MTFWPEVVFQPEMLILQEIAFRPEMATSQNWTTNQLYFGQKLLFCQKLLFSQNWLFRQNWLFGQKWLFGRNGCSAETALRQKYFCQIWSGFLARNGFLAWYGFFQMNLPYFSKYWKVWLAFDGWKLSGLFLQKIGNRGWLNSPLTQFRNSFYWMHFANIAKAIV